MVSTHDVVWFAGLFEGEGNVGVETRKLCPRVRVEMVDADVIERAAAITGGSVYRYAPRGKGTKPTFRLIVTGEGAVGWLMTMLPLLGARRREQVRLALEQWKHRAKHPGGWVAHRARYGCNCQQHTGSCQRRVSECARATSVY